MRCRLTVLDDATGLRSDVILECEPTDATATVLDLLAGVLPVRGAATVGGVPLDAATSVEQSELCDGAVVVFGGGGDIERDSIRRTTPTGGVVVHAVSGPSAGTRIHLADGRTAVIGRGSACDLTLADPDVSRRHATVHHTRSGILVHDEGSANGLLVDGRDVSSPHRWQEGEVVQLGTTRLVLEDPTRSAAVLIRAPDGSLLLNRRFSDRREPFAAPSVTLPTPVAEDDARGLPVLAMALPLVMAVALALFLGSPTYLLFGLLSPVLVGGNWWSERRRRQVRETRQHGSYHDKLAAAVGRVESAVDEEDADLRRRLPDPLTVVDTALGLHRELWARRAGEDDWLWIRLGTADRPASVEVSGERPATWVNPVVRSAPVGGDLGEVGVLGIAGPADWLQARLDWVLVQCAVLHSPDELRIIVLAPGAREDDLGWSRWLPHVVTARGDVLAAWDDDAVDAVVQALGEELDRLAAVPRPGVPVARVLVVLTDAGELVRRPQIADLLSRGPRLGFRFVCGDADDRLLPDACRAVLTGSGREEGSCVLRIDRGPLLRIVSDSLPTGTAERVARALSPLRRVGNAPTAGMPASVRFTDLTTINTMDGVRGEWRLRRERTDVVLGCDADGPFHVDIARDGPHAVVAGTSGAGKSELLQTWIAALALANTPEQLSVVFMDYKGGAAFRDLVALPHVVGTVTNLDERLAVRALSSLRAELTRRQNQLATAGASDRADYVRRAAADPALPPFPRLLVVVDELAELKDQLPNLVEGLVGVARIGRSLGVHLILATQKPAGVVDSQIRANVDLRICLRTRDDAESMEVVEVGDAARIPKETPGRALVLRGGAAPTLVQTARVTTPCVDGAGPIRRAAPLHWSATAAPPPLRADDATRTDLHRLVEVVAAAAAADALLPPFRPWKAPLPQVLSLDDLPGLPGTLLLGLHDRPDVQRQEPLRLPLGEGHLVVIGSGRTGRTSVLRTIAADLVRSHAPSTVHVHAVDGAGALAGLAALPHVGVVASDDDPERLERLLVRLVEEMSRRGRLMADRRAASIAELGADAPPAVVLLVDDWVGVTEDAGTASAALQRLLTGRAVAAGMTVCIAGDEKLLRQRLLNRFDYRLCLRLNNPSDVGALELGVRVLPDGLPPGRGLWGHGGTEVQVPLLSAEQGGSAQARALAALAAAARERCGEPEGPRAPLRLDSLPERIGSATARRLPVLGCGDVVIGVSGDRLSRVCADIAAGPILIAGPPRSGRSTAAASIAMTTGATTVLVASRAGDPHRAAARAGVTVVGPDGLDDALLRRPAVVVVDDADVIPLDEATVVRLIGPDGPSLVVAASLDSFGFGARGLVRAAKQRAATVVLLCPPHHMAAENVGVRIERGAGFAGPAGRAFLAVGGDVLVGQVPDPTAD